MFWYVSGYSLSKGVNANPDIIKHAKKYNHKSGTQVQFNINTDTGYIILSGEIVCNFNTKTGQSLGLISLSSGECYGGSAENKEEDVVLIFSKDAIIAELSFEELHTISKASEPLHLSFSKGILSKRVVITSRPEHLIFKSPDVRLQEAITILSVKIGKHSKNAVIIKLRATSERLHRMVGLGSLHTILSLASLYNKHLVIPSIKTLYIPV
ncbi:MAG: hypothetical protein M1381_06620 [Deltaproteobacteria bacterium]|nr:hypothetical protein [Deltaproteobacteria bacterium]MCL5792541.1 hypothetical protein [Deltaproteobacteria bacterium]